MSSKPKEIHVMLTLAACLRLQRDLVGALTRFGQNLMRSRTRHRKLSDGQLAGQTQHFPNTNKEEQEPKLSMILLLEITNLPLAPKRPLA
jgi:hypothetical protein